MALRDAVLPSGKPLELQGEGPFPCTSLAPWAGLAFFLPPGDERLLAIHEGNDAPSSALDNLVGMRKGWEEYPDWLDFLDPSAPNHQEKCLERDLYLHHWEPLLPKTGRVLDLGGGVGRFAQVLLRRGLDVELVDPDLRSLWRALQHVSGLPGRIDLHWSTGEVLPEMAPVSAAIAAEVLCYTEDPQKVLENLTGVLEPGGLLFCSVEARLGWACALDVAPGSLEALLGEGVVHVPGDRWIHCYTEAEVRALFEGWDLLSLLPTHFLPSGPFEAVAGDLPLAEVIDWEARLRTHPDLACMHRAWIAVARWPGQR